MNRVVTDRPIALGEIRVTIRRAIAAHALDPYRSADSDADHIIDALADLVATSPRGLAVALTRWRSELCGAADILPHIHAEQDRLKSEVTVLRSTLGEIRSDVAKAARILAQHDCDEAATPGPVPS